MNEDHVPTAPGFLDGKTYMVDLQHFFPLLPVTL